MFQYLIIDFDSTFVTVESLDELAGISLQNNPERDKILKKIDRITKLGMDGTLPFYESLEARLQLFQSSKTDIEALISLLKKSITPSFMKNKDFFLKNNKKIYIVTGGFREYIVPVLSEFGISQNHILANTFVFNKNGTMTGLDKKNFLAYPKGKAKAVKSLKLSGKIVVIGDGYTDFEIKKEKAADIFVAFVENVKRDKITKLADKVINNFDELLTWINR